MGEEAMGEEPPQGAAAGGGPGGAGDPGAAAPAASVKPIYCNFGFDARAEDVRAAFAEHGVVARVDIKQRYAFVFMETQEAAEAAVEKLHETEFGPEGPDGRRRRLVVNFARGDGQVRRNEERRKANMKPSDTLFVVGFDVASTKGSDLEPVFSPYGKLVRTEIPPGKNFAFIQFAELDDAKRALEAQNGADFLGTQLIVEFVQGKRSGGGGGGGGGGGRNRQRGGGGDGGGRGAVHGRMGDRGDPDYNRGPPPSRGYERGGYGRGGYERGGYDRGGYERGGYDRGGYDRGGYERGGHDRDGYDRGGSDRGYERGGSDRGGYERGGSDRGYERGGSDRHDRGGRTHDPRSGERQRDRSP